MTLLDFGLATRDGEPSPPQRGGVGFYYEPEFARAVLNDLPAPPASFAGEQYALAAMLYLLVTGSHTQDFKLERIEMLGQIAAGSMLPFAQRSIEAWPALEAVLCRALSRDAGRPVSFHARVWERVAQCKARPVPARFAFNSRL